jgi:16S rRNA (guanine527-N7)-methyltransferase
VAKRYLQVRKELKEGAERLGIKITDSMLERFEVFHEELLLWNRRMNLISRGDEQRIVRRHFLDSLNAVEFVPPNASILDIGSGAGFPGVPMGIVRNDVMIELLEPKLKRFEFLSHLVGALGLEIKVRRARVEDVSERYDVILSRSVGKLEWLVRAGRHVLASGGRAITYKGSGFEKELEAVKGWTVEDRKQREFCRGSIVVLIPTC